MLDVRCLEFSNGVLAASALFHFSSLELVEQVSGEAPLCVGLLFLRFQCRLKRHLAPPPSCSSEEGGGRGVREVDGPVRRGAARGRRVAAEGVLGNRGGGRAQHPDARRLPDVAREYAFILKGTVLPVNMNNSITIRLSMKCVLKNICMRSSQDPLNVNE